MPLVDNHPAFLRERLERMPGDEESGFDAVFVEEFEQAAHAQGAGEETARDIACRVLAAVAAEPAGHGVDVD
ncbi:hypothetical protein Tdes44962_MAKER01821 [Teratosphaeria destructans]|uniref:Uncharacterized protein n=1 Tax=Teratosphaeria destructans TaxID=418781 RepID=A0A9W7SWT3_9PEZI|nr:hypothetical protein Tdes44962_MAKER01821 [Teratosphaeria destructans]